MYLYWYNVLVNTNDSNYLIHRGTTITDVYAIYKETCLNLQATTRELEESKRNFKILEQVKIFFIFILILVFLHFIMLGF